MKKINKNKEKQAKKLPNKKPVKLTKNIKNEIHTCNKRKSIRMGQRKKYIKKTKN